MTTALVGATLLCAAFSAQAVTRSYTLYITSGNWTINGNGGATLAVWTFTDVAGMPKVPGPILTANEGDALSITVVNNHTANHNFLVKGLTTDTTAIAPGTSKIYNFSASKAGTYVYSDTLNTNIDREMGLYGMLWIGPSDGSAKAWTNGPAYNVQRLWVLSEMDKPRWNDVAGSGGAVATATYKPNYSMMNGKGGSDAMSDANIKIMSGINQTTLVRMVNAGQLSQSLHFHCDHFQVIRLDGVQQSSPFKQQDVINIPPYSTADVLFTPDKTGTFVMHNHTAQMETANGVYLNGVSTMIQIQ